MVSIEAGVWMYRLPSAGAAFAASSAMRPPAPGRFSTNMLALSGVRIRSAKVRATMSEDPPGGQPSKARMVRCCAKRRGDGEGAEARQRGTAGMVGHHQRPLNTAWRFSAKARCASLVSSVEDSATVCDCS